MTFLARDIAMVSLSTFFVMLSARIMRITNPPLFDDALPMTITLDLYPAWIDIDMLSQGCDRRYD